MTNLDQPWLGSWKLVEHRGFHEWLTHRGATADEATANIDALVHHTVLQIESDGRSVALVWSTKVRGKLRRTRTEVRYSLDGVTPTVVDGPTGPVSFTAHVDDDSLVLIGGPMGSASETHRRRVVDHQLVQIMSVEGAADDAGSWCELVWERS
jgi:hypothetical protein